MPLNITIRNTDETKKDISFVIASYNRPVYLGRCVQHIIESTQSNIKYEIVIINDGSKEDYSKTLSYLREISKNVQLIYTEVIHCGQARAKNLGSKLANSDILGFIDDDVFIEYGWAQEAIKEIREESADVVTGIINTIHVKGNIYSEFGNIRKKNKYLRRNKLGNISNIGGIIAIRKEIFDIVGGYNEIGFEYGANMSTDVDLTFRLTQCDSIKIKHNNNMKCWQNGRLNFKDFWKQNYSSGYSLQFHLDLWQRDPIEVDQPQNSSIHYLLKNILINSNILRSAINMKKELRLNNKLKALRLGTLTSQKKIAKDLGALKCKIDNSKKFEVIRNELSNSLGREISVKD